MVGAKSCENNHKSNTLVGIILFEYVAFVENAKKLIEVPEFA